MVNGKFGPGWTGEVDEGQEMSGVALVENQGGLRCHLHPFYVHALCRRHARGVFCTRRFGDPFCEGAYCADEGTPLDQRFSLF